MRLKCFCGIILSFMLLISCETLETTYYDLASPALEGDAPVRIVLITDLHSNIYGKDQSVLISKIADEKPDLIFLAGDIIDDKLPLTGTRLLLEGIKDIAPVYYVTGNHEYKRKDFAERMGELRSYGVVVLSDTYETVTVKGSTILIAGIHDPYRKKRRYPRYDQAANMEWTFRKLDEAAYYKILLAHRPEKIAAYSQYAFDLVVSGHAHGGQWRLPRLIPNGLYAPNQGLFPRYTGGRYTYNGVTLIVSKGLSFTRPLLPRFFNSPELVVISLSNGIPAP